MSLGPENSEELDSEDDSCPKRRKTDLEDKGLSLKTEEEIALQLLES